MPFIAKVECSYFDELKMFSYMVYMPHRNTQTQQCCGSQWCRNSPPRHNVDQQQQMCHCCLCVSWRPDLSLHNENKNVVEYSTLCVGVLITWWVYGIDFWRTITEIIENLLKLRGESYSTQLFQWSTREFGILFLNTSKSYGDFSDLATSILDDLLTSVSVQSCHCDASHMRLEWPLVIRPHSPALYENRHITETDGHMFHIKKEIL